MKKGERGQLRKDCSLAPLTVLRWNSPDLCASLAPNSDKLCSMRQAEAHLLRLRFLVGKLGTIINEAMSRRFLAHRKDSLNGECTHTHTRTRRHTHAHTRKARLERKTQQVSLPCDRSQLELILYTDNPCIAPLLVLQWRSKKKWLTNLSAERKSGPQKTRKGFCHIDQTIYCSPDF